ncbi:MAG: Regulator of RpoS [Verrucomicrobiae bacterium]|nr:Regulator of RpoS [Verrucomicrobiae bacterium]
MRILIAEDDAISARVLESALVKWGHEVCAVTTGAAALAALKQADAPQLAILDWMMPEMDGVEVCLHIRPLLADRALYIILLTARGQKQDIVAGLEAGADDYLVKPFDREELRARLNAGIRILNLQAELTDRVRQLEVALQRVHELQGLLPICCYCKKVRDDQNYWHEVENYISTRSGTIFSHGICPDCRDRFVKAQLEEIAHPR